MRLLITTQAVDQHDPTLGFFHRWLEEFGKHCEQVEVVCLRAEAHALPQNIRVHVLPRSRIFRAWKLLRYSSTVAYDAVFVHMNPEYLVVAGWLWKMRGTKTALWYVHKSVNLKLRIAAWFADIIFTASRESFRLKSSKVQVMGHGIDTAFFTPEQSVARGEHALSVGRLMKSKRHDLAIRRALQEGRELRVAGEGPEQEALEALARELGARVTFVGPLTQVQLRDEYRRAAYLIHTSETGSLDKVVLEALSCGLPVKTSDPALKPLEHAGPEYVREHHSLQKLIPRMLEKTSMSEVQVHRSHYHFDHYGVEERFTSYFWQLKEVLSRRPSSVLEVGVGDKVFGSFVRHNTEISYIALDVDPDLKPDIVGSVLELPLKDKSYDITCAFEVLEHIPFEHVEKALHELARVARSYVVISVPHFGPTLSFSFKLPFVPQVRLAFKIPYPRRHMFNGQHYWELGKRGFPVSRFRTLLRAHGEIVKDFVPWGSAYHHFFVVKLSSDGEKI